MTVLKSSDEDCRGHKSAGVVGSHVRQYDENSGDTQTYMSSTTKRLHPMVSLAIFRFHIRSRPIVFGPYQSKISECREWQWCKIKNSDIRNKSS